MREGRGEEEGGEGRTRKGGRRQQKEGRGGHVFPRLALCAVYMVD
jgi:hypothetical protein